MVGVTIITPEAGTTKTKKTRTVPVHDHQHLVEMGFTEFAKAHGPGRLFYHAAAQTKQCVSESANPQKPFKIDAVAKRSLRIREILTACMDGLRTASEKFARISDIATSFLGVPLEEPSQ